MDPLFKKYTKRAIFGVVGFIVLLILLSSFTVVAAGERGVVLNWGAFNGQIMEPGLHFVTPIGQSVVKVNIQTQSESIEKSEAYSKDLQIVDIQSVVNWNVKPDQVGVYYQQYGAQFSNILVPRLEAVIKQVVAQYSAEEILQKRGEVQTKIFDLYTTTVPNLVDITNYSLVNESFSTDFESAIEKKQVAQQDAERAENELKKVQIEAEQRVVQAKAEAEAIKIQAEAIQSQGGTDYVQLQAIEKWNGILPAQMIPGSTVPFINLTK